MKGHAGPEGGNCLSERRVMSEWDVEPFPSIRKRAITCRKGGLILLLQEGLWDPDQTGFSWASRNIRQDLSLLIITST